MTEQVGILSRSPRKVRMALASDRRCYEIPARDRKTFQPAVFKVDADFLEKWAAANWDAEVIDLLQWPGKPFGKRSDPHDFGAPRGG